MLDDEIVITLPGTNYAVTYYRATPACGAAEAVLLMLKEIGSVDRIPEYIRRAKNESDPFQLMVAVDALCSWSA